MIGYDSAIDGYDHYDNIDLTVILPAILITLGLLTIIGCICFIIGGSVVYACSKFQVYALRSRSGHKQMRRMEYATEVCDNSNAVY